MTAVKKTSLFIIFLLFTSLLHASELQVKVIKSEDDLPEKFCTIWKKGDYLVTDGKNLVLIGGSARMVRSISYYPSGDALGTIISIVPAGKRLKSDLLIGTPYIRINNKRKYVAYTSMEQKKEKTPDGSFVFKAAGLYEGEEGKKAQINTTYSFFPQEGRIDISSTITNTGKIDIEDLQYSVYFNVNHRYSFSPFHRKSHPDLNFSIYPKNKHSLGWMNQTPLGDVGALRPGTLAPGESFDVHYILLVATQTNDLLNKIYQILDISPEKATLNFKDLDGSLLEVIIRDAFSSSIYFRSFLENPFSLEVPLPQGLYRVQTNIFPAVKEQLLPVEAEKDNTCILEDSPTGKVKVKITNSEGEFVPGKVTFIGLDPTKSPYFKPDNPIKSGKRWESFKNSCYPKEQGLEIELPVGTYLILASRGLEYTMDHKVVEILMGDQQELMFVIDNVVETGKFISMDPHMHTQNSDGRVKIAERIKSIVAEGVDVAISTDHNYITDYSPALKKLGLGKYLKVIAGNEVTVSGMIHYNTYPLTYREKEVNNGAIDQISDEVTPLFDRSRKKDPDAIIQVNHPRAGTLGYFNNYQLELDSAATAQKNFDTNFHVIEVMNGPYFYSANIVVIKDWLNLLNRGYFYPIIGSSDAHGIDRSEPGYSRTYVSYEGDRGQNIDEHALIQAIKKGRSFLTNGPFVEFKINDKYTQGDSFSASDGKVNIWMKIQSAPWISVDKIRLIINGERKIVFNVKTQDESIVKFSGEIGLTLTEDSYIVVEVLGKKTLFPVLQAKSRFGYITDATLPYALTNPVFVDVDGNGKFDPPLLKKIEFVSRIPGLKPITR